MTSERSRQIEDIYHRALEIEESQRGAFLRVGCAGDEALQREVESLLDQTAGNFASGRAVDLAAGEAVEADVSRKPAGATWWMYVIGVCYLVTFLVTFYPSSGDLPN